MSALLPAAVEAAKSHFAKRRNAFEETINAKLNEEVAVLDAFKGARLQQLERSLTESKQAPAFKQSRHDAAVRDLEAMHDEYFEWMQETLTTEPVPWIRVICAMTAAS